MPGQRKRGEATSGAARSRSARAKSSGRLGLDSEQSARVLLIGGVALIVVVALAFIGFGYYWTEIRPEHRTVLQVDDVKVSYAAMKRRMNYELFASVALQQNATELPTVARDALLDELTIVSRSDDAGVTLDDAAFDTALRQRIAVAADADQRSFQEALRRQLDTTGLSETEYRRLVRAEATETALKEKFQADLPATVEKAKVEAINAQNEEDARAAIERINAGELFADVAKELSIAPGVDENGGLLDFAPRETMPEAYRDYAFSADVGQLSEPLQAAGSVNYYVVRVVERSQQPLAEDEKPSFASDKFDEWLTTTKDTMRGEGAIVDKFDEDAQLEALADVVNDARPRLIQQQLDQIAQQTASANQQATALAQQTVTALTPQPTPAPVTPAANTPAASTPEAQGSPAGGQTPEAPAQAPQPGTP
jgi:parvulin-like peptidyl-prolyl isomerase